MKGLIQEAKRMQQLAGIIKESQLVVENNNVVTNYTVDRESEKAVLAKIPYVTGQGDEKSLSVWVPKSTLEKNNGIPLWIVQKQLETLKSKGYRYDTVNIMRTLGNTAADVAAAKAQEKRKEQIFWNFIVDVDGFYVPGQRISKDDIANLTKLIKYTDGDWKKPNNREEAQQVIDQIVNKYSLDKLPLVVFKTLAKSEKQVVQYTDQDPFKFNNVKTREDRFMSQYYTTPEHRRII